MFQNTTHFSTFASKPLANFNVLVAACTATLHALIMTIMMMRIAVMIVTMIGAINEEDVICVVWQRNRGNIAFTVRQKLDY